ncbi:hypothetical protein ACFQ7J_39055, partial [Streptomyces sp. NPDC056501]
MGEQDTSGTPVAELGEPVEPGRRPAPFRALWASARRPLWAVVPRGGTGGHNGRRAGPHGRPARTGRA